VDLAAERTNVTKGSNRTKAKSTKKLLTSEKKVKVKRKVSPLAYPAAGIRKWTRS
jgi:hypothetical protein